MNPGDPIFIPYPLSAFQAPLIRLKGGEYGTYKNAVPSVGGETFHEIVINGMVYPLREGEFSGVNTVEPAQEYDNM